MGDNNLVNSDSNQLRDTKKSMRQSAYRSDYLQKKDSEFLEFKRNLNKLLLNEETVGKMEDARESKFYFEKMRCLELSRLTLMVMAQAVAILDYEIEFKNLNDYYAQWFLYITLFCSILLTTKQLGDQATIYNTGQLKYMLLEMSIYLIFPQPWFSDIKVTFFVDFHQIVVFHYLNEILLLIMLLRFLIMIKIILINTKWYTERVNRVCNLYATRMSPMFIVKVNMQKNPMKVFWFCYVISLFVFSYAIRICERPLIREETEATVFDFNYYATAIWCMLISIPSVGYGDKYPTTSHGRFIAAISFISGTFMLSVLCNSLVVILSFDGLESKANLILNKLAIRDQIKYTATRMFSYVARIAHQQRHNQSRGSTFLARKLRKLAVQFKSINRSYKSLVDQSNLIEQMDKQFTYVKEEFSNYAEQLQQTEETQKAIQAQINLQLAVQETSVANNYSINYTNNNNNNNTQQMDPNSQGKTDKTNTHKRQQMSSVQYYTEDMTEAGIKLKPYNFTYNMVNHVHPNQFY